MDSMMGNDTSREEDSDNKSMTNGIISENFNNVTIYPKILLVKEDYTRIFRKGPINTKIQSKHVLLQTPINLYIS